RGGVRGGGGGQGGEAGLPRERGRQAADERQRVGEARAVHVQFQPVPVRRRGDRGDLFGRVDRAALRRLGDADRGGLREVHHAIDRLGERFGELPRVELAGRAVDAEQPRTRGVALPRRG